MKTLLDSLKGVYSTFDNPALHAALDPSLDIWCEHEDSSVASKSLGTDGWGLAFLVGFQDVEASTSDLKCVIQSAVRAPSDQEAERIIHRLIKGMARQGLAVPVKKNGRIVSAQMFWSKIVDNPDRYQTHECLTYSLEFKAIMDRNGLSGEGDSLVFQLGPDLRDRSHGDALRIMHRKLYGRAGS